MIDSLFPSGGAAPAVRKPITQIRFGGGSAGGGLDSLAGSVGSALGIDLGGSDAWADHLVALRVELGLAPFVDSVALVMAAGAQAPTVAVDDTGTVALGYADESATTIFTGKVVRIRQEPATIHLLATNGSATLAHLRLNQSYEQQTAGEIVAALASAAEVATDTVENGVDLPFYSIDDSSNAYGQITHLARRSGYAAWFTPEGKLTFAPLDEGDPVATLTYGENLLSWQINDTTPLARTVTVIGEGAAGSQGTKAWSWLVKDPSAVTGQAGSGNPAHRQGDAALRSSDAVQSAATAALHAASRLKITGKVVALGAPTVLPGSTLKLAALPQPVANGNFLVERVIHQFSKQTGFTTEVRLSKASASGGGDLLAGLL